jgi:hypothetical protein
MPALTSSNVTNTHEYEFWYIIPLRLTSVQATTLLLIMARLLTLLDVGFLFVGLVIVRQLRRRKTVGPLPPGPKKRLLLGNLLDMPTSKEWTTFAAWGEQWGKSRPSFIAIIILTRA